MYVTHKEPEMDEKSDAVQQIDEILRVAESMKLFERDDAIHYGRWREWYRLRYDKEASERLLEEFRSETIGLEALKLANKRLQGVICNLPLPSVEGFAHVALE